MSSPAPSSDDDVVQRPDEPAEPLLRAHRWVLDHWPATARRRIAALAVIVMAGLWSVSWLARLAGAVVDLGLLAYVGLMVVCWVGAGGALVPIPGARPLSWVMIVHQGAVLVPPAVALSGALAMALGQSSLFAATRAGERRHAAGHGPHWHHVEPAATDVASDASGNAVVSGMGARAPNRLVSRSRELLSRGRAVVERRMRTHPMRIVFTLSVIPNPLTTFATVSAASTGVPYRHFFVASLSGFLVLTSALVIAGQSILAVLGLS